MQPGHNQLSCNGCRTVLAYPDGAPSVRCPLCTTVTPVMQIHITCVTCRTVLALPHNTTLAMCPRCRTVMSVPPLMMPQYATMNHPSGPPPARPKTVVYVENPPTTDESGKVVNSMAVGTKIEDDPS
eukprot:PhF_6_TR44472/c0_g1_i3/m.68470